MMVVRMPCVALGLAAAGCVTMQPVTDPARFFAKAAPPVVYVTYTTGAMVPVTQARVSGDSLFGTLKGLSHRVAVPLSRVQLIEAVQRDKKRTAWLIAGLGVAMASAVWALSQSGEGEPCDNTYYRATCQL
jgi:hypothetical protein